MANLSLSGSEKSIEDIWSWYEDQKEALRDFNAKITSFTPTPQLTIDDKFIGLTKNELSDYFKNSLDELEHLVALDIIAATEGTLKADFFSRVMEKDKHPLGREFRIIYKKKKNKVSLEEDIIEGWKKYVPESKSDFGDFLGLLYYRHWLAHGRYWTFKKGRRYSAFETYGIAEKIIGFTI